MENWTYKRLGDVVNILDSKRVPLSEVQRQKLKGKYPYCGANGIIDYISDYIFDGEYLLLAEDGGNYGRFEESAYIMIGKFWVNNHAHILSAIVNLTTNKFLLYSLNFIDLNRIIVGATRKKLNQQTVQDIKIKLPPLKEQKAIAQILSTVDKAIEKADEAIKHTEQLKQGLMQKLLTEGIGHTEFKETKIGRIPKEWEIVELDTVVLETVGGGTPSTKNSSYWNGKIYWMTSANINGMEVYEGQRTITEEGLDNSSTNLVTSNNILVATRVGIGKLAINRIDMAISQDLTGLILNKNKIFVEFLYFSIISKYSRLKSLAQGSTIKGILKSDLLKLKIPLPTKEEQQEISAIIIKADKKLELEKQRKQKLVNIKKGLMNDLLTGKKRVKV